MGLGTWHVDQIELTVARPREKDRCTPMTVAAFTDAFGDPDFDVERRTASLLARSMSVLACFSRHPVIRADRCVRCGICVSHCPVPEKALSFQNGKDRPPVYDRKKCIHCFCCQEMCPQKAITSGPWWHK